MAYRWAVEIRELWRAELTSAELSSLTELANLVDPDRLPGDGPMPEQMVYGLLCRGGRFQFNRSWAIFEGERAVAVAQAEGSVGTENADLAEMLLAVHPSERRRGLGSRLYEGVRSALQEDRRSRLWVWGVLDDANRGFWEECHGFSLGYDERASRCVLGDVDAALMQSWIDRAGQRASGYRLERWNGPAPDEFIGHLALAHQAMNDAPLDDLELEDRIFSAERARDVEKIHVDSDFEDYVVLAVETATNDVAGFTAVMVPRSRPERSYQAETVTLDAHRNLGIGRWLKADMWQWLRAERPDIEILLTGNAESNAAMLAINVEMGYRPFVNYGEWH